MPPQERQNYQVFSAQYEKDRERERAKETLLANHLKVRRL